MNTKPILERLLKLVGKQRHGRYRIESGIYTILWRDAIMNEGIEALSVGLTDALCTNCDGEGETPGSWAYYPCNPCKGTGFMTTVIGQVIIRE